MCERREKRVQGGGGKKLLPQLKELAAISPGWASLTGMSPSCPYAMPQTGHNKEEGGFPTRASICYRPHNEQTLLLPFPTSHPPIIFFFFFCQNVFRGTSRGEHNPRMAASTTERCFTQQGLTPDRLGSRSLSPQQPPKSPRSHERSPGPQRRRDAIQGPPEPKGFSSKQLTCQRYASAVSSPKGRQDSRTLSLRFLV